MPRKIVFERHKAKVKERDDKLTPLEIAAALETDSELPFAIAPLLSSGQDPVGYVRDDWSEDASYYTSGKGATRLIVAFAGRRGRLGVAVSCFLQTLRDEVFDVIILRDPRQLHFTHGVRGLGNFLESITQIKKFAEINSFEQIITFGHSMGGLPALRAGGLLGAQRAICVGGRYPWHPGRLTRGQKPVCAFDLLCACASPSTTEVVYVYAHGNEIDRNALDLFRRSFPACTAVPINVNEHGVLGYFYKARLLPLFMAYLIEYWDDVDHVAMLARLESAARHTLFQDAATQERFIQATSIERDARRSAESESRRLSKRLEAVCNSYSWRITSPLRAAIRSLSRQH